MSKVKVSYDNKWLKQENGRPWKTDKGGLVPKVCPKCGEKVGIFLRGEPVFLCTGTDHHYFGTVGFFNN